MRDFICDVEPVSGQQGESHWRVSSYRQSTGNIGAKKVTRCHSSKSLRPQASGLGTLLLDP